MRDVAVSSPGYTRVGPPRNDKTAAVLSYIAAHSHEHMTVGRAARDLGLSASSVRRIVKQMGVSGFHRVLEACRVFNALTMLDSDATLKTEALCRCVGWKSRRNLYAAVRRICGHHLRDMREDAALREVQESRLSLLMESRLVHHCRSVDISNLKLLVAFAFFCG